MLAYKESKQGQILHLGINEAGSVAAFTAAGTSYATHGEPMIPVYVFYSMFGFQRTGDAIWAAGDQMARGFLIGATAGRTTLTGEGLQHADGHSPLLASTNPAVVSYDPAYGYEIAHIVQDGLRRMYGGSSPTERHVLPDGLQRADRPARGARGRRRRGHPARHVPAGARLRRGPGRDARGRSCSPPASGCRGRSRPRSCCADDWGVAADVWSVTSWSELRRDGLAADEQAFLHPERGAAGALRHPAAARTPPARSSRCRDYMRAVQDQIRPVGARRLRDARRRRLRLLRHPAGRPPLLPHRRPLDRGAGAADAGQARRDRPRRCRARRPSATGCTTSPPARPATPAATS